VPNIKSAEKRMRQNEIHAARNRAAKSRMKSAIKKVDESIQKGDEKAIRESLQHAVSIINQTAQKGIIHDNKASRLTSNITQRVNSFLASQQESSSKES